MRTILLENSTFTVGLNPIWRVLTCFIDSTSTQCLFQSTLESNFCAEFRSRMHIYYNGYLENYTGINQPRMIAAKNSNKGL